MIRKRTKKKRSLSKKELTWQMKQITKPLAELIKEPNCKMLCPKNGPDCCSACVKIGPYKKGELESKEESVINNIRDLWDSKKGYLGENGCLIGEKIHREHMPKQCLSAICKVGVRNGYNLERGL